MSILQIAETLAKSQKKSGECKGVWPQVFPDISTKTQNPKQLGINKMTHNEYQNEIIKISQN